MNPPPSFDDVLASLLDAAKGVGCSCRITMKPSARTGYDFIHAESGETHRWTITPSQLLEHTARGLASAILHRWAESSTFSHRSRLWGVANDPDRITPSMVRTMWEAMENHDETFSPPSDRPRALFSELVFATIDRSPLCWNCAHDIPFIGFAWDHIDGEAICSHCATSIPSRIKANA